MFAKNGFPLMRRAPKIPNLQSNGSAFLGITAKAIAAMDFFTGPP